MTYLPLRLHLIESAQISFTETMRSPTDPTRTSLPAWTISAMKQWEVDSALSHRVWPIAILEKADLMLCDQSLNPNLHTIEVILATPVPIYLNHPRACLNEIHMVRRLHLRLAPPLMVLSLLLALLVQGCRATRAAASPLKTIIQIPTNQCPLPTTKIRRITIPTFHQTTRTTS